MSAASDLRARARRVFVYDDEDDNPAIPSGVLDVDEQDKVIETLRKEDLERTQRACRLVSVVTILPFPYFLVRFLFHPSWFELSCMVIVTGAYITGPSAESLEKKGASGTVGRGSLFNLASVAVLTLYYWASWWNGDGTLSPRRFDWSGDDRQVLVIPLVVSALSFFSRILLVPTDLKDLVSSKYNYIGA